MRRRKGELDEKRCEAEGDRRTAQKKYRKEQNRKDQNRNRRSRDRREGAGEEERER